jgi:hypothetical protein
LSSGLDPVHERAVSDALERAVVTLLMANATLCGGFLYVYQVLAYAKRFAVMIRLVVG